MASERGQGKGIIWEWFIVSYIWLSFTPFPFESSLFLYIWWSRCMSGKPVNPSGVRGEDVQSTPWGMSGRSNVYLSTEVRRCLLCLTEVTQMVWTLGEHKRLLYWLMKKEIKKIPHRLEVDGLADCHTQSRTLPMLRFLWLTVSDPYILRGVQSSPCD